MLGEEVRILVNYLKLCDSFDTGKLTQVRKSTNFEARLYDITTFPQTCIFSMYHYRLIFGFL